MTRALTMRPFRDGGNRHDIEVLELVERFDLPVPEPVPSPVAQLKPRGRRRRRASTKRKVKAAPKKWPWGDEQ
jgi:hypothetical protein